MSQQPQPKPKENVFDENGELVTEDTPPAELEAPPEYADPDENQDPDPDRVSEAAPAAAEAPRYTIGDKSFATQAEALAYAESLVTQGNEVDAYRQVLRETIAAVPRGQPAPVAAEPAENAEELYTNPNEYLRKRDERIKSEVLNQITRQQATAEADARTWREFTDRHPDLADFREEVTLLVQRISPEVQAVGKTKGPAAAYDYVATKFRAQAERVSSALAPKRPLKASGAGAPAGAGSQKVTPPPPQEKILSSAEQLRSMRRRRQPQPY